MSLGYLSIISCGVSELGFLCVYDGFIVFCANVVAVFMFCSVILSWASASCSK